MGLSLRLSFLVFLAIEGISFGAEKSWEELPESPAQLSRKWVDAKGDIIKFDTSVESRWFWQGGIQPRPVLRTWVETVSGSGLEMANDHKKGLSDAEGPGSPFLEKASFFDTSVLPDSREFKISELTKDGIKAPGSIALVLAKISDQPYLFLHPSCTRLGVYATQISGAMNWTFAALFCEKKGEAVEARLVTPASVDHPRIINLSRNEPETVEIAGASPEESSSHIIGISNPDQGNRRWNISPKAMTSFINYTESTRAVSLSELGLSLGAIGYFQLVPNQLIFEAAGDITALPLVGFPSRFKSARIFSSYANLGYAIPLNVPSVQFVLAVGGAYWTMIVPGDVYGVQDLTSPQLKLSLKYAPVRRRSFSGYFQFAPLTANLPTPTPLSWSNRAIGFGAEAQLTNARARRAWYLTLGISSLTLTSVDALNTMSFFAVDVGVRTPIF